MSWFMVWVVAAGLAVGQDGEEAEGPTPAVGDVVWLTEDVTSERFLDDDAPGSEFKANTRVTTVFSNAYIPRAPRRSPGTIHNKHYFIVWMPKNRRPLRHGDKAVQFL